MSDPGREEGGHRVPWIAAALVVLLAGIMVVRTVALPAPHAGGDNAAYLSLAASLAQGGGYVEGWDPAFPPHAKYPPAYPLLLALLILLGVTTWGGFKALSAGLVVGAGLLVLAWAGGRRGTVIGGAVALLALLSSGWAEASRWVLSEPLFLVAVFLGLVAADRAGLGLTRSEGTSRATWTALAAAGALLALLSRTAGLPLLLGLLGLLAWNRRWRALAWTAGGSALPVLLWVLRGRAGGEGAYQDEFWLANPYIPEMGRVGVGGILARVWTNLEIYVGRVLGGEWWGGVDALAPAAGVLGVLLLGAGLAGWGRRLARGEGGLAELFLPLYGGLVLVWPETWSGDRFVLPLYPLLLFWGVEAVEEGVRWARERAGGRARGPAFLLRVLPPALLVLALGIPGAVAVAEKGRAAEGCRVTGALDPWACWGPAATGFRDAAAWAGENLPPEAVVINRKPRIFHALGGTPGRVFPFFQDPEPLLELADALGARYLLFDSWDGISRGYLPAIVGGRPEAFCWIREFGEETVLLGIRPPGARGEKDAEGVIGPCDLEGPEGWLRPGPEVTPRAWGQQVPVVVTPLRRRPR